MKGFMGSHVVGRSFFSAVSEGKLLWCVFLASLVLSLIASFCNPIIGRDAALYMDLAGIYQQQGVTGALQRFDWPWFSILLGMTSQVTGLSFELLARVFCELLTAVACVACVDLVRRFRPASLPWACFAVLAVPAFNDYRGDILRENGFWAFSLIGLCYMQSWVQQRRPASLLLAFLAVVVAAAFRFEAVYLLLVVPVMEVLRVRGNSMRRGMRAAIGIALIGAVVAGTLWAGRHGLLPQGRVAELVDYLDLSSVLRNFHTFADGVAQAMPFEYARDSAPQIILFGLLCYVASKVLGVFGVLMLPLFVGAVEQWRARENRWLLLDIAAVGYIALLLVFALSHLFLSSRYVAFAGFLLLPRVAWGLSLMAQHWPRTRGAMVVILVAMALANVVSLSAPKTHLREAGHWVGAHLPKSASVYQDDNRVSYYAGWGYGRESLDRDHALALTGKGTYEYFVLDLKRKADQQLPALLKQGLVPLAQFHNRKGETYVILRRGGAQQP
ncbi:hypothetical protein IB274_19820 [Pseudomonas sp. PDM18]|uniref:hypothetical protein n=1 Tax=Pseudomonas sp. PDM18 TaxID=2769253 RepID=UPI00177C3C9A|nr:hypothetical protein [Pseudomonas sp. PDM18]MBD9678967.1 hypothetical protein [Pseudomonas sp. PDM18]